MLSAISKVIFVMRCPAMMTLLLLSVPGTVMAQQEQKPAEATAAAISAKEMEERVKYATDFADIKPIREAINRDIEAAAMGMDDNQKEEFMCYVQLRVNYDEIEAASIKTMAEMFTVAEIKAMIAYYGSPEGKSAEGKAKDYASRIGPMVTSAINGAMMDMRFGAEE